MVTNSLICSHSGAMAALVLPWHFWLNSIPGLLCLLFVGLAGTTVHFAQLRIARRFRAPEQPDPIERERDRIARDIHDHLGSGLTRIIMLGERAAEDLGDHQALGTQLRKIVASARTTVQSLDEIVWAINPENDTLEGLIEYISHYADEFFEDTNVNCHLDIPTQLPSLPLSAELRHDLFLIVKEAINNILKHAKASEALVQIAVVGSQLEISVHDNGCGFNPNQTLPGRKRNGLANMRQRIESLGGQFCLTTAAGAGTRLQIGTTLSRTLPL